MLSQGAVTAWILLNGHGHPCIVPVKHLTFCPSSEQRESVHGLGDGGFTEK